MNSARDALLLPKEKNLLHPISITAIASISPLGKSAAHIWKSYKNTRHYLVEKRINDQDSFVAQLPKEAKSEIDDLRESEAKYRFLDDTVLFAIYTSRNAIKSANWAQDKTFGINFGSSRGATQLFETYHKEFLESAKTKPLSSPTTTLGNISSWVAHDLNCKGPEISHSITCSTALHAVLNGIAWINSGLSDKFLVGGSEAPLTAFTIAQMRALKIYANQNIEYPCRALDFEKKENTMVLGEAAVSVCLEKGQTSNALALISGIGYATELLEHNASLSTDATCFQRSMKMALGTMAHEEIDVIITHTPGTLKGDQAEFNAIEKIFCNKIPSLTTNKWKLGHTLGTSGLLSLEMAILMLQHQEFIPVPYVSSTAPKQLKNIMINAVGFGGNAVTIILTK